MFEVVEEKKTDPLAATLAAADAGAPPAGDPAPGAAPPALDDGAQWIGAAMHFGAMARAVLPPKVAEHWTPERLNALGVELANCAKHYGWTFGAILNHPLAKLAAVSLPLAWPLIEPYAKPYLAQLTGREEKPVEETPPDAVPPAAAPIRSNKVEPIG